eukprot:scaffold33524_cov99-Skeletonema_dohrnii-CCMP3373.AAC.2
MSMLDLGSELKLGLLETPGLEVNGVGSDLRWKCGTINPAPIFGLVAGTPWLVASGGGRHRFRATGKDRAQFPGRNLGGFAKP